MFQIDLINAAASHALGARLAPYLRPGDCIALTGGLGAGKTTLVRGLIQALCGPVEVPSPTYTLVQTYETRQGEIWHCDLYRLEHPDEVEELGLLDALYEAICLIEWPDRLGSALPEGYLKIDLCFTDNGRQAKLTGDKLWKERLHDGFA